MRENPKNKELIAATATPPGCGGIGVIRLSGAGMDALEAGVLNRAARSGRICKRSFLDANGAEIDCGLALRFTRPRSYTGEDVLELHAHGGPAVICRLLGRCTELGARPAEPGEFTRRAYLNGRMDLAQAEGVADLISATTERAAKMAAASAHGELSARCAQFDSRLSLLRAELEASLDFTDEDLDTASYSSLRAECGQLAREVGLLRDSCARSAASLARVKVVLVGAPNSGKSSLLNLLAGASMSIVDSDPGTTRDIVRASCDIHGTSMEIADTAGLRESGSAVEREGMLRTRQEAQSAEIVVLVVDSNAPLASPNNMPTPSLVVLNKIDLSGMSSGREGDKLQLSARTGEGLDLLREALAEQSGNVADASENPVLARQRHIDALQRARRALAEAAEMNWALPEIAAEVLRQAHNALGEIGGRTLPDDLLGQIFQRFCIGK